MRSRWNAGWISRRCRVWRSSSLVKQTVAEQHPRPLQADALVKRSMMCDEDVPDTVGMIQEGKGRPGKPKEHDVAIRIGEAAQEPQPVAHE